MRKTAILLIGLELLLLIFAILRRQIAAFDARTQNAPETAARFIDDPDALQAQSIDAYFRERGLPLAGYGRVFVDSAKCGIDPYLLPAIAMKESTGGKFMPRGSNNPFGWGSGRISFKTMEDAISFVGWNLCGLNPRTTQYYAGKTTRQILQAYNPPSIEPLYSDRVMAIMEAIRKNDRRI